MQQFMNLLVAQHGMYQLLHIQQVKHYKRQQIMVVIHHKIVELLSNQMELSVLYVKETMKQYMNMHYHQHGIFQHLTQHLLFLQAD